MLGEKGQIPELCHVSRKQECRRAHCSADSSGCVVAGPAAVGRERGVTAVKCFFPISPASRYNQESST